MTLEWMVLEQTNRSETFGTLEKLEGFQRLSEKQQRMIRASLFIQDRAERPQPQTGDYDTSKEHAEKSYCHAAVQCLEKEIVALNLEEISNIRDEINTQQGMAVVHSATFEQVQELIEKTGFPAVVLIGFPINLERDNTFHLHEFVALGQNAKGEIIAWEKENGGIDRPYRLISLEKIYKQHVRGNPKNMDWGARSFRKKN